MLSESRALLLILIAWRVLVVSIGDIAEFSDLNALYAHLYAWRRLNRSLV
jgi:hypothetical protein